MVNIQAFCCDSRNLNEWKVKQQNKIKNKKVYKCCSKQFNIPPQMQIHVEVQKYIFCEYIKY